MRIALLDVMPLNKQGAVRGKDMKIAIFSFPCSRYDSLRQFPIVPFVMEDSFGSISEKVQVDPIHDGRVFRRTLN